jgi:multidrug transporter EmrE-like cation transporter
MYNILLPLLVILFTTYSQLVLRVRLQNQSPGLSVQNINLGYFINLFTDVWLCSAIVAFFLSFVFWTLALSGNLNVTKAYPIVSSLTIFLVSFSNYLFFQDKMNLINLVGGVFIGIFLLLADSQKISDLF